MKEKLRNAICAILALLSTYAVRDMLKGGTEVFAYSNSIFSIFTFAGAFWLIRSAAKSITRRSALLSCCFGLFFSICTVFGANLLKTGGTLIAELKTWRGIICGLPLFAAAVERCIVCAPGLNALTTLKWDEKIRKNISGKPFFFVAWALIFLAWVPGLIASYPGIHGYDSVYQEAYYASGAINLHHPLIHTYMLGFFVQTLGGALGSAKAGLLLYSIVQMLILSAVLAAICLYAIRRKISIIICAAVLLGFMLLPTHALMSFSSTKDVLFAAFFALLVLLMLLAAENPLLLRKKRFLAALTGAAFLFVIFRNQGIYVFIFGSAIALIFLRKQIKQVLAVIISVLILYGIYSGPVTSLLGGYSANGVREMMSVPCMQLSRAMIYSPEQLTEDEQRMIAEYIPQYQIYRKDTAISDGMKNSFNSERFAEKPFEFIKLWAKVGIKCPIAYIDAFARLTIGLWYPDMNYRDPHAYHPYWEYKSTQQNESGSWIIVPRDTPSGMQWLADKYEQLTYQNTYQRIPVLSMLLSSGMAVWLILLYVARTLYCRQYRQLVPAAFAVGLWLTMLLGPVVLYRYIYPLVLIVPLLFCSALNMSCQIEECKRNG